MEMLKSIPGLDLQDIDRVGLPDSIGHDAGKIASAARRCQSLDKRLAARRLNFG
jgi:hypothetical protein